VFSAFAYADTNSTTTTITGNDQYLIQNKSTLRATVSVADKATAQKSATMSSYHITVADKSEIKTWSNVADVVQDFGSINAAVNQTLTVRAVDSRNAQTAVNQTVNMVPYTSPVVVASGSRLNNFEATTTISISGSMALLQVAGVTKNEVNSVDGVQYRYKDSASSTWGDWTSVTSSTDTAGNVTVEDFNLTLDNKLAYNFEVKITDKLDTTTQTFNVAAGIAIFRIGADEKLYHNGVEFHEEFGYGPAGRFSTTTTTATLTPNINTHSYYRITAQAGALSIAAPTGTPYDGQGLLIEIQDNGTTRALTWDAAYVSDSIYGLALPTTTTVNKTHFLTFVWNDTTDKWTWVG
jgi:hypothetical protein